MIDVSNEDTAGCLLLLEMAFQTQRRVAFIQQALVDGSVRRMADGTTLAHRLVLIYKRAPLLRVTLEAGLIAAQESEAAGFERLLNVSPPAFDGDSLVRIVAIGATHFAFQHRVVMRQLERRANFQVTLETGLGGLSWVYNGAGPTAGFDV